MYLGTLISHHLPYDLQGDLHLLFACGGGFALVSCTLLNVLEQGDRKLLSLYELLLAAALLIYIRLFRTSVLSELLIIVSSMLTTYLLCIRKGGITASYRQQRHD